MEKNDDSSAFPAAYAPTAERPLRVEWQQESGRKRVGEQVGPPLRNCVSFLSANRSDGLHRKGHEYISLIEDEQLVSTTWRAAKTCVHAFRAARNEDIEDLFSFV